MVGVLVEQRQVGRVWGLVHQRTLLRHTALILAVAIELVLALGGGDGRVGVGVVGLHAKVAYVLYHVYFKTIVLGIAQVGRHVVSVGAAAHLAV